MQMLPSEVSYQGSLLLFNKCAKMHMLAIGVDDSLSIQQDITSTGLGKVLKCSSQQDINTPSLQHTHLPLAALPAGQQL
jgi:hypothetical protein